MKKKFVGLLFTVAAVAVASYTVYKTGGERLALLDEKVETIKVSKSAGLGQIPEDHELTIEEEEQIAVIEAVLRNARLQMGELPESTPDYDLLVEYEEGFPAHPLHLWMGQEGEEATLTYTVEYGDVYKLSAKDADEIRKLIQEESDEVSNSSI
ncbi:hypothetical protein MKY84_13560 [Chryseomicrobium sp. FSL W7-1435]|uniref:hypothetical protein n=1 Tax=Chryseomicrobium sp. FSL W7-1435 TaxID=2921704 RepID=UPI003159CA67